jgi:hypothetical protein
MKRLKHGFHDRLGISQQLLAGYLNVGRSTLTMHEWGNRSLPTSAILKMGPLSRALDGKQQPASLDFFANEETAILKKEMETCISNCNYKLTNAKFRLKKMQPDYEKAMNALKVAGILLASLPNTEEAHGDRAWLKLLESEAWQKIRKCGLAAQTKLKLQIEVLEFELAAAQARLAS